MPITYIRAVCQSHLVTVMPVLWAQIEALLPPRRVQDGVDHSGIKTAALQARLLLDDMSIDALGVVIALLQGRAISGACGQPFEVSSSRIMEKLNPMVRFAVGLEELIAKDIVSVDAGKSKRHAVYRFKPQMIENRRVATLTIMPNASARLAMYSAAPKEAVIIVLRVRELMDAAVGKGDALAVSYSWLVNELESTLFELCPHDGHPQLVVHEILGKLDETEIVSRSWWQRKAPVQYPTFDTDNAVTVATVGKPCCGCCGQNTVEITGFKS